VLASTAPRPPEPARGFRVLDGSRRDYMTGHWSPIFDAIGIAADVPAELAVDAVNGASGRIAALGHERGEYGVTSTRSITPISRRRHAQRS